MSTLLLGLVILIFGIVLIIVEAHTPGFFLMVPGTAMIIFGCILMAFPSFAEQYYPAILFGSGIPAILLSIYIYRRLGYPEKPSTTNIDTLVGKMGVVTEAIVPDSLSGKVRIGSEIWSATSIKNVEKGKKVKVLHAEGVHVVVEEVS